MQQQALGCVQIARANVRLSTQVCGTADMASLEGTLNLLETTDAVLRQVEPGFAPDRSATPPVCAAKSPC